MLFDLGLHESCETLVKKGKLTQAEATFRHKLFLATFVYDSLWSLYLGRPSSIPLPLLRVARRSAENKAIVSTLDIWVSLCIEISEIANILNGPSLLDSDSLNRLGELDSNIRNLADSLPTHLAYKDSMIFELDPTAYGFQVQLCGIQIVLHRILSKGQGKVLHSYDGLEMAAAAKKSRCHPSERYHKVMHENAVRIARLVMTYRQLYGIDRIITVMLDNMFVAAAALISDLIRSHRENGTFNDRDIHWLRLLFGVMESSQKHYLVTARMRDSLFSIMKGTSLATLFPAPTSQLADRLCSPSQTEDNFLDFWNLDSRANNGINHSSASFDPHFALSADDGMWLTNPEGNTLPPWPFSPID